MDEVVSKINAYFEQQGKHPVTSRTLSRKIGVQAKKVRYVLNNNNMIANTNFKKMSRRFVNDKVPLYYCYCENNVTNNLV